MNYDVFKNKKVYIFIPHQDDEINIAYGLIYKIRNITKEIKVVYSTNGNSVVKDKYRLKEGIKSLKYIGIKKEDIIFMGYSDQIPEEKTHLYHEDCKWYDKKNNTITITPYNNDYHYLKYNEHAIFNKNNFINDIRDILESNLPDIIIGIDFDSHPDHRALSLSLEKALGVILKNNINYRPIVLKSFAYPTSYKGYNDFDYNNKNTRFIKEKNSLDDLQNPYYNWSDRIIFKNHKKGTNYLYLNNIYFFGLLKHKSQYILNRINQIINNDLIYFERKTNNLLFDAKINSSSGNVVYLNDFMLFDTNNIMGGINRKVELDEGFTILKKEDKDKQISFEFNKKVNINIIKIYIKPNSNKNIKNIIIKENGKDINVAFDYQNNIYIFTNLNLKNVSNLIIKFDSKEDISIGEIEIFEMDNKVKYALLEIDDNVYNDYYCKSIPNVNIFSNIDIVNFEINKSKKKIELIYKDEIIDVVNLHKLNRVYIYIVKFINKVSLLIGRIYQKVVKEIRKIKNKLGL